MQELTIIAAAEHLHVSTATVKRRLRNGTLKGRQIPRPQGYTWLIEVDQDQDNHPLTTGSSEGVNTPVQELSMVAWLQEELTARRREISELHVLLQNAQAALPAPRRLWWKFWK